jgi:hypothetical protein
LEDICYPEGRNLHQRKVTFRFTSAFIHNTRTVMGQLEQSRFKRMECPSESPNLTACDFILVI